MEKIKAIVTVKLNNISKEHTEKFPFSCPVDKMTYCTDSEGAHHSFLVEIDRKTRYPIRKIRNIVTKRFDHITRIEVIDEAN